MSSKVEPVDRLQNHRSLFSALGLCYFQADISFFFASMSFIDNV